MSRGNYSAIGMRRRREMVGDEDLYGTVYTTVPGDDALGGPRIINLIPDESLKTAQDIKRSRTARSDRRPGPSRRTGLTSGGNFNFELAPGGQMEEIIEELFCSEFSTALAISGITISFDQASSEIRDSANGFTNVRAKTWIKVAGAATGANNGRTWVTSKTSAGVLVVAFKALVDEAAGATVTITGQHVSDGSTLISTSYERDHTDLTNRFQAYLGQVINSGTVTMDHLEIMTLQASMIGRGAEKRTATSVFDGLTDVPAELLRDILTDASNNMRMFREGAPAALDGNVRMFDFTLNNNAELVRVAQDGNPASVSLGTKQLTGNINGYLVDAHGRPAAAEDHDESEVHVEVVPDSGPIYVFTIHALTYDDYGDTPRTAENGPVMLDLPFTAETADLGGGASALITCSKLAA